MTFEGFIFEKYADGGWQYTRPSKIYGRVVTQSGRCVGDAVERYEGQAAYGEFWIIEFLRMDEMLRDVTRAVFDDIDVRGAMGELQHPAKLHRIAMGRLKKWGLLRTCPRCGGSGHYSYNTRDGTQCYGCGGLGYVLPTKRGQTKEWFNKIKEAAETVKEKPGSMTAKEKRAAGQKPVRSIEQFDIYQDDTNGRYYTWDNGFQEWIGSKYANEQDAVDNAEFLSENEGAYRG